MLSEEEISCLHCPVPCSSWELESLGAVGCAEVPLQSHMLSLLPPLPTSIWTIASSPESSAGTGRNLWPMERPCCTPASSLPHIRKASKPSSDPNVSQEWQQGARMESIKADATALQRTEAESQGGCGPSRQEHGPGLLSRAAKGKQYVFVSPAVFIFKQY